MGAALPRPSEDELIARYLAPLAGPGALGLSDDCATLTPSPGTDLVVTADAVVEGVHYLADDPPASIARKALGVNVSDLAAKGAVPRGFLLTLALAEDWTEAWLAAFCTGLSEAASACDCALLGGDTVRAAGRTLINVAAFGEVPAGGMIRRSGARPGDRLCVTGTIGDATLGLALRLDPMPAWGEDLTLAERTALIDRYLHPQPRLALRAALRAHARVAMDVSDGLVGDLAKMLRASDATARVALDAVPLSPMAARAITIAPDLIARAVTGGDDYEILCAVPPGALGAFRAEAARAGLPVAVIGTVEEGTGAPVFLGPDGAPVAFTRASFSHF